jgi:acyl CoA:acetate/3-ketoacid CoA transferase
VHATPSFITLDEAVARILQRGGNAVAVAAPLGLGKPNHLLNALYARFKAEPARQLTLYTAK